MSSPLTTNAAGSSFQDLDDEIKSDFEVKEEIDKKLKELQEDIDAGKPINFKRGLNVYDYSAIVRDLVERIEKIEAGGKLTATDRMMVQKLTKRWAVCEEIKSRLAHYNSIMRGAHGMVDKDWNEDDPSDYFDGDPTDDLSVIRKLRRVGVPIASSFTTKVDDAQDPVMSAGSTVQQDNTQKDDNDSEEFEVLEPPAPFLYRVMGLPKSATQQDIESQYKLLEARHHPKHMPNDTDRASRWTAITAAYEKLSDPDKRNYYDLHGGDVPEDLQGLDLSSLSLE